MLFEVVMLHEILSICPQEQGSLLFSSLRLKMAASRSSRFASRYTSEMSFSCFFLEGRQQQEEDDLGKLGKDGGP